MDCNEFVELVTAYLEGSLDLETRARFDMHLLECEGCENYLQQFRAQWATFTTNSIRPSATNSSPHSATGDNRCSASKYRRPASSRDRTNNVGGGHLRRVTITVRADAHAIRGPPHNTTPPDTAPQMRRKGATKNTRRFSLTHVPCAAVPVTAAAVAVAAAPLAGADHTLGSGRATGQDQRLDAGLAEACTAMFLPDMPRLGRQAGIIGPEVTVAGDASPQDRLLGAMGRTP